MQYLEIIIEKINEYLYTYILIVLLISAGIYFTIKTRFVQIRLLPEAVKLIMEKKSAKKGISSFQALMISTASRVGTGNISGVASAIALGGSGAIFWMWVLAILGGASAFVESTLAQIYKTKNEKTGEFCGGPAYYIQKALGLRWLGILFSVFLIMCFAYGFNLLQAFNVGTAVAYYVDDYQTSKMPIIVGIILAVLTAIVIFGGVKRIGNIVSSVVPIMAILYISLGIYIIFKNFSILPNIFSDIFKNATDFKAIFGGFVGSCVMHGIKRGLFSNEAGMGSAPNAAATADVSHPVKQGLVQTVSVFIDTLMICTTTSMILLCSGVQGGDGLKDISFVQQAVNSQVGEWGIHFITISIFLFAFSSLIGNYYYTESNLKFITKNKIILFIFRVTCIFVVYKGSQLEFEFVWNLADVLMGLMASVNIVVILLIGKYAKRALDDYCRQKKEGKNPVFKAKSIDIENTEFWK